MLLYVLGFQIQPDKSKTLTHSDKEIYLLDHSFYLLLLLSFLAASLVVTPVKILHSSTSPPVHNRASIMIKTSQISFVIINRRCSSQHFILIPTTPQHAWNFRFNPEDCVQTIGVDLHLSENLKCFHHFPQNNLEFIGWILKIGFPPL